jgi:hypothetical protein
MTILGFKFWKHSQWHVCFSHRFYRFSLCYFSHNNRLFQAVILRLLNTCSKAWKYSGMGPNLKVPFSSSPVLQPDSCLHCLNNTDSYPASSLFFSLKINFIMCMCVYVLTHAHKHTHNPITFTATNQFLWNVMSFMVKLQTFCKHPNFTLPEQQINQEPVSFWK